jgi:hypothetical protein
MAAIRDILITGAISNWFAIVGLLTVWLYYRSQIRRGRIQAIDFWDRSGIRMFLLLTPNDRHACFTCHTASGTAILARDLAVKREAQEHCRAVRMPVAVGVNTLGFMVGG